MNFLTLKPEAFGLDISDLSLKIIQLEKDGGDPAVVSFGEKAIREGVIREGEIKNEDTLAGVIKQAVSSVKGKRIASKYVIASLPEEKAFLQVIQMPRLSEEDLKSAVIYEAENHIPLPIEEVYLDFQIIPPLKNRLNHYDVLIAAVPKKIVNSYSSCLDKAGLKPLALEIESLSIARALVKNGISRSPLLLIDFGATRTGFIVFSGTVVRFTSTISVSSHKLTEAIARTLKLDLGKAEKLKIETGLKSKERDKVFDALIPSLTDLVEQIKKHLNFYQTHSNHEHLPPDGKGIEKIMLCGGGANLKGLTDFLSSELRLPVELGNPMVNISGSGKKEALPENGELLGYATALGLSLRGIEEK